MSFAELVGHDILVRESIVESRRFGIRVIRVTVPGDADADGALRLIEGSGAELVVLRFATTRLDVSDVVRNSAWNLVPAGTVVYWDKHLQAPDDSRKAPGDRDVNREATARDRDTVAQLIPLIFDGYRNHYSMNPALRGQAITDGYTEWALSRVNAPDGFVTLLRRHAHDVGVATVALETHSDAEVELAGIHPDHQGQGHYATLMQGVERQAWDRGARHLVISTQASNIRVQRAWVRLGYAPCLAVDTVHLMPSESSHSPAGPDA
jgi:GNAT superfamily N-acetyltransferase